MNMIHGPPSPEHRGRTSRFPRPSERRWPAMPFRAGRFGQWAGIGTLACVLLAVGSTRGADAQQSQAGGVSDAATLVEQLGAEEFSVRERATGRLIEMGLAAKQAVEAGRTHPDREIRYRCERIFQIVGELDFQRRLTAFTSGRSDGSDLPGWRQFRDRYGDDGETRGLFVEMQKAESELLQAIENGPQGVGRVAESRTTQLQLLQRRAGEATSLGSIASLLFAAVGEEVNLGLQPSFALVNLCSQPSFIQGMSDPAKNKTLRKMLSEWITQSQGAVAQQSMFLAMRHDMKEGLIPATRILQNPGEQPFVRQTALMTVAKLGDASHAHLLEPALTDTTRISSHRINNVQYETQLRDVALAALLFLKKQDPKQFGFDRIQFNESNVFNYGTVGFENEDQRKQAFAKYDEFKAHENDPR
jgi:hypothetical protein